jgi:hypothetical protein
MIRIHHAPEALMFAVALASDAMLQTKVIAGFASYHFVAEVDTDDLNQAYRLTNTVEGPWWRNFGVKFLGSIEHGLAGSRSTSIGDVLEHVGGACHIVARCGFVPLNSEG